MQKPLFTSLRVAVVLAMSGFHSPARAFDNIRACDIVNVATTAVPGLTLPSSALQDYQTSVLNIARILSPGDPSMAAASGKIMDAQDALLNTLAGQAGQASYLNSQACHVLVDLKTDTHTGAFTTRLVMQSRLRLKDALSRTRFASEKDVMLFTAGYNCFIAGYLFAMKPLKQGEGLSTFGQTRTCKELDRAE